MAVIEVTSTNHDTLVENNKVVVLKFWAPWCGPCRSFAPVFEASSEDFPEVTYGEINVDNKPELSEKYQVRSIPSIVIYRNGELVRSFTGGLASPDLRKAVSKEIKKAK